MHMFEGVSALIICHSVLDIPKFSVKISRNNFLWRKFHNVRKLKEQILKKRLIFWLKYLSIDIYDVSFIANLIKHRMLQKINL